MTSSNNETVYSEFRVIFRRGGTPQIVSCGTMTWRVPSYAKAQGSGRRPMHDASRRTDAGERLERRKYALQLPDFRRVVAIRPTGETLGSPLLRPSGTRLRGVSPGVRQFGTPSRRRDAPADVLIDTLSSFWKSNADPFFRNFGASVRTAVRRSSSVRCLCRVSASIGSWNRKARSAHIRHA